jgi:hypothetical protein
MLRIREGTWQKGHFTDQCLAYRNLTAPVQRSVLQVCVNTNLLLHSNEALVVSVGVTSPTQIQPSSRFTELCI